MTVTITTTTVVITAETAEEAVAEQQKMLTGNAATLGYEPRSGYSPEEAAARAIHVPMPEGDTDEGETEEAEPKRERGQPSPGKSRRTKAEIAEDEEADRRDAEAQKKTEQAEANISTDPENRQDPENPDAEQDAADEAAETAAAGTDKPTHDDMKKALGKYVNKFGMEAAQEDGPKLIAKVLGEDYDAAKPRKISDIPADKLERAIAGCKEMLEKNPFKREEQSGGMFG